MIRDLAVTAIHCTPSYPAVLEHVIAEHFPVSIPAISASSLASSAARAGLDEPAFRARLEQVWASRFAMPTMVFRTSSPSWPGQSEQSSDLHFIASDVLYPEIVAPDTGNARSWKEGETGELVLTHLARDLSAARALPHRRCDRGDRIGQDCPSVTAPRFRVTGRSDDMVVVRGLNMFPAMVQGVVNQFRELSGEYRIVLDAPPPYDVLPIEAELARGAGAEGLALRWRRGSSASLGRRRESRSFHPRRCRAAKARPADPSPLQRGVMYETVLSELDDKGVRVITLNRPKSSMR